jgi:DNA-binding XRE family transcriptional regulator
MNGFKLLRKRTRLTQEKVAEMLRLSKTAVQKWEYGETCPGMHLWPEIAKIYNVEIETILRLCEVNKSGVEVGSTVDLGSLGYGTKSRCGDFVTESHRYAHELLLHAKEEKVKEVIKILLD